MNELSPHIENGSGTDERNASPENRTLREIFDRDKEAALDLATELIELIPDIEFDGWFEDDPATDANRPMRSLLLARQLCDALENVECVKIIMAKEA